MGRYCRRYAVALFLIAAGRRQQKKEKREKIEGKDVETMV